MNDEIKMIPIDMIRILNPRPREKKKFDQIVESIKNLGLKKPIQVSLRSAEEGNEPGYDLVCGQGRMQAFQALGYKEIPAIIVAVTKEERMLRSLVENIARRNPSPLVLMTEIERLKEQGYSNREIGTKLDLSEHTVAGYIALKQAGEQRLIDAAISGRIPLGVAMEIAQALTPEMQRELLTAYEKKELNKFSIRTVKRIIEQRRFIGKGRNASFRTQNTKTSAEALVCTYKKESQRQKLFIKKARVCEAKLLFVVTAFNKLLADAQYVNLLRAESLLQIPEYFHDKLNLDQQEVA